MSSVKIIKKQEELSSVGCELLLHADEATSIRLTSTEMRWLTIKKQNSDDYYTIKQKEVCEFIDDIANNYGSKDWAKLNIKILLYKDPTKKQEDHMKKLIKAGSDIRYISAINTTKIISLDNKLFISFARTFDKVVNTGILYTGDKQEDPLINYCKKLFDDQFLKARKITLDNKGNLVFTDNRFKTMKMCIKAFEQKDWITLVLGAVLGTVVSGTIGLLIRLIN